MLRNYYTSVDRCLYLCIKRVVFNSLTKSNMSSESDGFFSFLLKPGSSLHPSFLIAVDCAFIVLFLGFVWSAYLTNGNVHFFILMALEIALWASVKWFVHELKTLPVSEVTPKKDQ